MTDVKSILLVGVGGQGTILASKILTQGLIESGYDVKMSEVHGMNQRSGSVSTQVRFGSNVYSPIIGKGMADILVSFEEMEAARYAPYLKKNGTAVINTYRIPSMPILTGVKAYPTNSIQLFKERVKTIDLNVTKIAENMGNSKSANIVLLGALVKAMGLMDIDWKPIIKRNVKSQFEKVNLNAFEAGIAAVS